MRRKTLAPRPNYRQIIEAQGLSFHENYWSETAYYEFEDAEINALEAATQTLHAMCLKVVADVISRRDYARFEIPQRFWSWIEKSWENQQFSLYGRFDFCFDGREIKLLEYNADTPTGLIEASVVQWFWMRDHFGERGDQWNSIHERLVEALVRLKRESAQKILHLTGVDDAGEDFLTVEYLRECALQAGFDALYLPPQAIGWNPKTRQFRDLGEREIALIFKLYPYEWLFREPFGAHLETARTRWIEPPWKAILSSKTLLVALWEMFPDHPLLLRASLNELPGDYARKPIHGREGANTQLRKAGREIAAKAGPYNGPYVFQELRELPDFEGRFPVCGAWVVNHQAAGLGIREDGNLITGNDSRFVPHTF